MMFSSVYVKLIRFVDTFLGTLICYTLGFFSFFSRKKLSTYPQNVAFIQLWGIGESVLTLPTIKAVKEKYKVPVTVICTSRNKDVFTGLKYIDSLLEVDIRLGAILKFLFSYYNSFELVIDFEEYLHISSIIAYFLGKSSIGYSHGIRSRLYSNRVFYNDRQHLVETHLDLLHPLGIQASVKQLEPLSVSSADKHFVNGLFQEHHLSLNKKIVGLAPGVAESAKSRMWSTEKWAQLADILIKKYKLQVVFVGSPEDTVLIKEIISQINSKKGSMKCSVVDLSGETSLKQLFYVIQQCTLFIGCDSGPIHLASAQGVKTIGLFCPNTPVRFGPYGEGNVAVYKPVLEQPCINVHKGQIPECKGHHHMSRIMVEDVVKAVEKIL